MSELDKTIKSLQRESAALEPGPAKRHEAFGAINDYIQVFLDNVDESPAYIAEDRSEHLYQSPITEQGSNLASVLEVFKENVERSGLNATSGGHLAYIPNSSLYYSALGDYLAAVINRFSGDFSACPGAVRMENMLIRWMAELIGYSEESGGNLASGGSIATLTAIVCARESHNLSSQDYRRVVVYVTEHTHHCVHKALHLAGMSDCIITNVPLGAEYRMRTTELDARIAKDKSSGFLPWLIVGSAGSTNTGALDDLRSLSEIASANGLWFHVDAAYGGCFLLSELVKNQFQGIENADSVVIDPHKGMFIPYGTGAVLVRDKLKILNAHSFTADYLQDSPKDMDEMSPCDSGPELTRHFRAVRMWLPLKLIGVAPFRAALTEKILLARYAYEKLADIDGFELGPYPDLSIFFFRYVPETGNADEFNKKLLETTRLDGRFYLSSTQINGKYVLRLAILALRTHLETIDGLLEFLVTLVTNLQKQ